LKEERQINKDDKKKAKKENRKDSIERAKAWGRKDKQQVDPLKALSSKNGSSLFQV
jgi:hypothetical protein